MIKKLLFSILLLFQITVFAQEDCNSAITVCGNSNINYTPSGIGNINENLGGCLSSGEHHSVWYKFTIATSGTLTFDLVPTGPVDYDWAIYGPNVTCTNKGAPIRCNASGNFGNTGMNLTNTNITSAGGNTDPYCRFMNVVAGQTYFLYLDNWSSTVFTFNLTWGGTATFVSPFTNPALAPNPFIPPGNPGPNANSPREISICSNTATFDFSTLSPDILNGNANFTVSYFNNVNDATTGNNPINGPLTVNTNNTYFYNINYNDPNNPNNTISACKDTKAIIFKNKEITANITAPTTVLCPNASIILTSNNATGNTWSTGEITQSITVTTPGTYTLTSSNGICTSPQASITITQDTDPNVQVTGNLTLCESPTQLMATATGAGNIFAWSNGTNGATTTVAAAGTYTVTVTKPNGCQYQKSVTVTQGVVPVVQNSSLSECSNLTTAIFDLTVSQPNISTTANVTFDYYLNQADAVAGNANIIANPTAHTSGNAIIYVRVKSATCSKIAELQLNVTQLAAPTITSSSTNICFGGNIVLTSSQTTGNTWSTGETTQSITVTTAGIYTLTNSNGFCTSVPVSITITAENDPNIQITGNLVICESPTQLTATATGQGNAFIWSNGTNGAINNVATAGTYSVTVTTPNGCQYQQAVTVTQGIVPVVQNTILSQCSDTATAIFDLTASQQNLSTTANVTFDYYLNQADAVAGNTNTITNPTTHTSGNAIIYVRIKSATCSKLAELQLSVNQKPAPVITASSNIICGNTTVTLTSNFPTGNIWSNGQTTQVITITNPGTYSLTNNNGTCTSNPVSITITQDANPNVQIMGNLTFCDGASTTLTATATGTGNTFTWSNGTNGPINTITTAGVHTVTVTTPTGCQYQESVNIIMNSAVIVNIAAPTQINCTNPEITLDATASVFELGASFLWTATGGGNIVAGANTLNPTVNNNGTYTLTITNPSGCINQATVMVLKNTTPPVVTINAPRLTICKGESVTLTANGAVTYNWTGLPGNGNTQTVSPIFNTTYTVTGTGANGCISTPANITIEVVPEIISTLQDVEICKGDTTILDAGSGPNYTYLWSTGEITQTINTGLAGIYTVTINNGACTKTFTAEVSYIQTPEIFEIIYKDNTLTIKVKNNGNTALEYSIDGGITWQPSNVFTNVLKNTQYSIKVRNNGAICYSEIEYYTFFMSNVITPNSDGINDIIDFSEISKYGNFGGSIFDKYGKIIFKLNPKNPIWDGKYIGRPLPTDTYWYQLVWEDRISKKPVQLSGWVLLKNRE